MSYTAAVDHLYARGLELASDPSLPPGKRRKFDLEHMRTLARALGNPQERFPSVLIAGTNGKGSTAATLASILTAAGYRTALYTSPHLSRVNERIQIDGQPISDDDFADLYFHVDSAAERLVASGELPQHPSFFETLTALAFLYFAGTSQEIIPAEGSVAAEGDKPASLQPGFRAAIDIAILEVGLGGRLDATNIVTPLLSIITDISLDHQEYLGRTIAEITREKTGILRPGGTLITLPQHPEANQAIGEVAAELGIHAINAAAYIPPADKLLSQSAKIDPSTPAPIQQRVLPSDPEQLRTSFASKVHWLPRNRYILTLGNQPLHVDSPLWGQHQQRNIALAIAAAQELSNPTSYNLRKSNQVSYNITNSEIEAGIRNTRWPGRLEIVTFSSIPPGPMARQRVVPTDAEVSGRQRNEKTGLSTSDADPAPVFPPVLLDVAHNPAGAWTLRAALAQFPEDLPRTLIFSCLRDKDLREMSQILLPLFDSSSPDRPHDHILFAPINSPRAVSLDDLVKTARELEIPAETAPTLAEALNRAWAVTPPHGLIVATGSVYLVGELRTLLRKA